MYGRGSLTVREDDMEIVHHGGAEGVTGSCHRLQLSARDSFLVDCGLFQGRDHGPDDTLERHAIEFPVEDIRALVVTHVHIDHIGRLPYLLAAGFDGPIICSKPSARLLPLMLEDALRVGFTRDRQLIEPVLETIDRRLVALDYNAWHALPVEDAALAPRVRLQRAGHILGSAYVEFDFREPGERRSRRVVFSGDLGAPGAPLLPAPKPPRRADTLVLESTYGDRLHGDRHERAARLRAAVEHAHANGGTVIVPAFSIGRTQELLYEFEGLIHRGNRRWRDMEVVLDSPLAARFTDVYRELKPFWDAEAHKRLRAGRHPLDFENLYTVDDHDTHLQTVDYLARSGPPAVVIAASGMAAGGRVVNYLKAMLEDERHHVLFVGYQAEGTPGRAIQAAGRGGHVELDGERYAIRAGVDTISGYSAHADQADLLRFVRGIRTGPQDIRLVHGEPHAREALWELACKPTG